MSNQGMLAAVAAAAGQPADEAEKITVDAAFVAKHFPETAKALREEGAVAENARITGIEKAAVPGHEAIIAAHKADRAKTPGDAALAVIAAQNAARAGHLSNLNKDEDQLKGLRSEPSNGPDRGKDPKAADASGLVGEAKWKAEWDGSAELQATHRTQAEYLALKRAEASGQVKRFAPRAAQK
jgi:hypothetical protein